MSFLGRAISPIGATLATALLLFAAPALAKNAPPRPSESNEAVADLAVHFTPEELEDLTVYARDRGEPLAAVLREFRGVSQFTEAVSALRTTEADSELIYAEWRGPDEGGPLLVMRPESRDQMSHSAVSAFHGVDLRFADLPTERELDAAVALVARLVADATDQQAGIQPNALEGRVEVTIAGQPGSINSTDLARELASKTEAVLPEHSKSGGSAALGIPVTVMFSPSVTSDVHARGGLSYGGCTGAFIVNSGTQWGISSAGHCANPPATYDSSATGVTKQLSNRDVQWTRLTSGTKKASFRIGASTFRTATSAADPVVGAPICHYGKATDNHCDRVSAKGVCWTYDGYPQYCGLFVTDNKTTDYGDSGGPYYYGTKAHGVHSGYRCYALNCDDMFSGIGSLALLSVTVNTG